jgi:hypothetical protein
MSMLDTSGKHIVKVISVLIILEVVIIMGIISYFLVLRSTGTQLGIISSALEKSYDAALKTQQSQMNICTQNLKIQSETNSFDRIRMGDATNILLALQNYSFDKNSLPDILPELSKNDYYAGNLTDPEFGMEYYYKKIDSANYVLCFYLSTGIWGTNKNLCPAKETFLKNNSASK